MQKQTCHNRLQKLLTTPTRVALVSAGFSVLATFLYTMIAQREFSFGPFVLSGSVALFIAYTAGSYVLQGQRESEARAQELAMAIEELATANKRLQAQNRELDAFAHTVAHDLQAPVSVMLGYSTLLEAEHDSMPRDLIDSSLKIVVTQVQRLGRIINELLLLSKIMEDETVKSAELEMADIVAEAVDRLSELREQTNPIINAPAFWPNALGHAPWIEEVWVNYLSNALKYGGAHPVVKMGADTLEDGTIRYWVQDNGNGLNGKQQATLFKRFNRLDQVDTKGHGLGLSIVKRIVERLGGEVGVNSLGIAGQGCTFWFTLPAVAPEMAEIKADEGYVAV